MTPPFDFEDFPRLETPRLVLREIRPRDTAALFACLGDPEVTRHRDMYPLADLAQARRRIRRWATEVASKQGVHWGIAPRDDDALVGTCGYPTWGTGWIYPPGSSGLAEAWLDFEVARAHRKRGLMAEALAAVLRFGFERMGLRRVSAQVGVEDRASLRLLEKLGFRREGVVASLWFYGKEAYRDLWVLELSRDAWSPPEE